MDDLPPVTVITHVRSVGGKVTVRGTTSDGGIVKRVWVNGQQARSTRPNFAEWEIELSVPAGDTPAVRAHAEDAAGNVEPRPHVRLLR